jgi:hypothetical protein
MLEAIIQDLIRQQRPYYLPQGNPVKGVDGQHWLVFRHRDADKGGNFLKNIVSLLGFKDKAAPHKILRIDPSSAKIYSYIPRKSGDLPSPALLRTGSLKIIEKFLTLERSTKEPALPRREGLGGIAEPPCFNRGGVACPSQACGSKQSLYTDF